MPRELRDPLRAPQTRRLATSAQKPNNYYNFRIQRTPKLAAMTAAAARMRISWADV
jgi:hypothetical protein